MKKVILFFVVIAFPFFVADCFFNQSFSAQDPLQVENAFSYPSLKGTTTGVVFAKLTNIGKKHLVLVKVETAVAGRAEIHEMKTVQAGVTQMRQLEKLTIAPKKSVNLEPGGTHVMLFDLKEPLKDGQRFTLTFKDDAGKPHPIEVKVGDRDLGR